MVAKRGEKVTPFLVGVLSGLGIEKVEVYDKIRVAVISTGYQLVDVCEDAKDGKIRDVNTSLISAFAINSGFEIVYTARVKDDKESIENAVRQVLKEGYRTEDIMSDGMKLVGTSEMGDMIAQYV